MNAFLVQVEWRKPGGSAAEKPLALPDRFDANYPGCLGLTGNGWLFRTRRDAERFARDVRTTYFGSPTYVALDDHTGVALEPNLTIRELGTEAAVAA
jgi:hypothetical protein